MQLEFVFKVKVCMASISQTILLCLVWFAYYAQNRLVVEPYYNRSLIILLNKSQISPAPELFCGLSSSTWGILVMRDKNGISLCARRIFTDIALSLFTF